MHIFDTYYSLKIKRSLKRNFHPPVATIHQPVLKIHQNVVLIKTFCFFQNNNCHRCYSFSVLSRSAPCGASSRCGLVSNQSIQASSPGVTAVTRGCLFVHWTAIWAKSGQLTLAPPRRSSE